MILMKKDAESDVIDQALFSLSLDVNKKRLLHDDFLIKKYY